MLMINPADRQLIYFIKGQGQDLSAVENFLNKREYQVHSHYDKNTCLKQIEELKPQYIFICFDRSDGEHEMILQEVYRITQGIVIPYCMGTQIEYITRLDQSQFEFKLYPPISGPAVQRILSKLSKTLNLLDDSVIMNTRPIEPINDQTVRDTFKDFSIANPYEKKNELPKDPTKLNSEQKDNLEDSFHADVKSKLVDLIHQSDHEQFQVDQIFETNQVFVLIIQDKSWTGYLTLASEANIDTQEAFNILNNWVYKNLSPQSIAPNSPSLVLQIPTVNFPEFSKVKSDHSQSFQVDHKEIMISLFSFSPFEVLNTPTENFNYLEVPVEFLKPKLDLPFEVYLFLPENNKFLNYIKLGYPMGDTQIYRLHSRNINHVYAPMQYHDAVLKYKAEFNLHQLIESYNIAIQPKQQSS